MRLKGRLPFLEIKKAFLLTGRRRVEPEFIKLLHNEVEANPELIITKSIKDSILRASCLSLQRRYTFQINPFRIVRTWGLHSILCDTIYLRPSNVVQSLASCIFHRRRGNKPHK